MQRLTRTETVGTVLLRRRGDGALLRRRGDGALLRRDEGARDLLVGARVRRAGVHVTPPRARLAKTSTRQPLGHLVVELVGPWQRKPPALVVPLSRRQRRGQPVLGSSVWMQDTPRVLVAALTRDQANGHLVVPTGATQERRPLGEMTVDQPGKQRPVEGASVGAMLVRERRVGRRREGLRVRRVGRRREGLLVGRRVKRQGTCSGTP